MSTIVLSPAGRRLDAAPGTPLRDVLFEAGVEFPCGGRGRCKGCGVKVLRGELPVAQDDLAAFGAAEIAQGWRLSCRHLVNGALELELAQWDMPVLGNDSPLAIIPREGLGIAVDLGTTTIAAQLLDLRTGHVLAVTTALNAQARFGADVLSRLEYAQSGGREELTSVIRRQIGEMAGLLTAEGQAAVTRVVLVGNTVMHHLFAGLEVGTLATHPFAPMQPQAVPFTPAELGWEIAGDVTFMPCIGGMVGSDILAGIAATGLAERDGLTALIDLGTNGEVVVAQNGRLLCTSTAAGPAFEGAQISAGMRAATGAISEVHVAGDALACRIIGGGAARGVCGSGLVDAVAAGLQLGLIAPSGWMAEPLALSKAVLVTPHDVRELQLAKAAIAAGLRILLSRVGASPADIAELRLAGAFGNSVSPVSASRVGLLRLSPERVRAAGNTALKGAKLALFDTADRWDLLAGRIEHVSLHEDASFPDVFAEEMRFPG